MVGMIGCVRHTNFFLLELFENWVTTLDRDQLCVFSHVYLLEVVRKNGNEY